MTFSARKNPIPPDCYGDRNETATPLERILRHFPKATAVCGAVNQYTACCPAHSDNKPSLSIGEGDDGRVLLHCHAGCSVDEICEALGITTADLFDRTDANELHTTNGTPHAHTEALSPTRPPAPHPSSAPPGPDFTDLAVRLHANMTPERRAELARILGLPVQAIEILDLVGYSPTSFHRHHPGEPCWTFSEINAAGRVVGIVCRYPDGSKPSMHGSHRALYVPTNYADTQGPIFLPEGPSCTAAGAVVGLTVIGRPNNTGGVEHLAEVLRTAPPERDLIVVGERDPKVEDDDTVRWPGRDGAIATAQKLSAALSRPVYWTLPPESSKDIRDWIVSKKLDLNCPNHWPQVGQILLRQLAAKKRDPNAEAQAKPAGFTLGLVTSVAFGGNDYRPEWMVKRLLVRHQPVMLGGPKKVLKTTIAIDLAVSLASGLKFLGEFDVCKPLRVALLSGESGEFTLQETARRICTSKNISLESLADRLLWGFRLPQLANPEHMTILREELSRLQVDVLLLDPLYLALLAGAPAGSANSSDLFAMGPLMHNITRACLDVGTTPIFLHHTRKGTKPSKDPLDLDDLAFAGLAEYARQWLLLSRREAYVPGTGFHELLLAAGGSVGHGGLWHIDVREDTIADDFTGRTWDVLVRTAMIAKQTLDAQRAATQVTKDTADDNALLAALDKIAPQGEEVAYQPVKIASRLPRERAERSFDRLIAAGVVERLESDVFKARVGNGAMRSCLGIRRVTAPQTPST